MRGKAIHPLSVSVSAGITPAYAGKSSRGESDGGNIGDHPRLCGEKTADLPLHNAKLGSPPPMRGKAPATLTNRLFVGITPAYAGKRCTRST